MKLKNLVWMPKSDNRDNYLAHIAKAAINENWGPDNRYLNDYIRDNFELAYKQNKVKIGPEKLYCLFRAGGLTTNEGDPITILATKNRYSNKQPYVYKTVFTRQRFTVMVDDRAFPETAPPAPDYAIPPYRADYAPVYNFPHYFDDHESRVEEKFPRWTRRQISLCIYGAVEQAHKRGAQEGVPQWYCDKNAEEGDYQWLLPLNFTSENPSDKPDFVATLAPNEEDKEYNIRTLLPPEFAYGHARAVSGRDPHFRSWA
jgi:hypothetical protein